MESRVDQEWFAKPNDLVGGWCVMNVDKTPAEADHRKGEYELGSFMSEELANHIANLHNTWRFYKQRRPKKYHVLS